MNKKGTDVEDFTVKYLIIRFSSIGDIVLTTPVIRGLKKQVPNAIIHFLTKKAFLPIVEANPYIDKIHVLEDSLSELTTLLKKENYHYIIDLHRNIRSQMVKSRLKAIPFSFDKINMKKWLMVQLKINRLPGVHIVDRYLQTVSLFEVKNDGQGLDYFIPPKDRVPIDFLPDFLHKGYIGFAIGAQHNTKKLTPEKIIEICQKLEYPVILLGGKEDRPIAEKITKESGYANIYNACGKFTLNQSASMVKQARCIITHDTGLMHIAAAFKKKIISVWGNTIPAFGMYPYLPDPESQIIEVKDLKCRPCSKIGYNECPKKHFKCINDIDTDRIVSIAKQWVTGGE